MRLGVIEQAYSLQRPFSRRVNRPSDSAHAQLSAVFTIRALLRATKVRFWVAIWARSMPASAVGRPS